ncbi:MAG: ABC transporter substrate-binding protein [Gammaproteobacteria bacterium]|nr:ABC transporter substrate-binding protein [Gammaproteobacteria bacterium]
MMEYLRNALVAGLLSLCLVWIGGAQAFAEDTPEAVVVSTTNNVLQILRKERDTFKDQPAHLFDVVEKYVLPHIDFAQMSRLVLGKYWNQATDDQQARFTEQFRSLLVRTYANALLRYVDANVEVLPSREPARPGRQLVRTEVKLNDDKPLSIDYSMFQVDGAWKIYDVKIDGVSLVVNYRASFKNEISNAGIEKLILKIKDKNEAATSG